LRSAVQLCSWWPASDSKAVFLCTWLSALWLTACADDDMQTRFGKADAVWRYRDALNPIIESVSEIEAEVQATAVGASGTATAANLAAVYARVLPNLEATKAQFGHINAPRRLANLHRLIGDLISLRIAAYAAVVRGFSSGTETLYAEAEEMLEAANALIVEINGLLSRVDAELAANPRKKVLATAGDRGEELY
jgi:hypothetical protein